jgi:DNA-binding NarL/FixJ family response regulator
MTKVDIGIVDDHRIFLDGLKILLSGDSRFNVVAEAGNGNEFLRKLDHVKPHIVLMDIEMPEMDGIETTQKIVEKYPDIKIIALSMHGDEEYYYRMIHAGAKGFLLKESKSDELFEAILKVVSGDNYFSQELLRKIIYNFGSDNKNGGKTDLELTKREREVLEHICHGLSNAEIAEKMYISQRTAEGHRSNLLKKTNSKNTASLIMYAIKNNLVSI